MNYSFDFLVIGGGIAGLTYALEVSKFGTVAVLSKKAPDYTATAWAQGGIAAVTEKEDSFLLHTEDTLKTGDGLCDRRIVELVVKEGPAAISKLLDYGVSFDKDDESYHLHKEGGHSRRRIFHSADATGLSIQKSLIDSVNNNKKIQIFSFANAIDIITTHKLKHDLNKPNIALGAYVLIEPKKIVTITAKKILLATGGAGKVYLYTSNPDIATGDGIAMSYRAGATVANMEFFQFHPTCLYHPEAKSFLITEAMRGEGAYLINKKGERFMPKHNPAAELAPRDIVARAIDYEMKLSGDDYVYLDITHKDPNFIKEHFPTIYERCLKYGIDITNQAIPVVPAAHYCCGGIVVDADGRTDIENLFAAGECSHTGLHGANRLASNSLLEGVVFALRASQASVRELSNSIPKIKIPNWDSTASVESEEQVIITQNWDEIRRFMWNYVGIVRSDKRLERALRRSHLIEQEIQEYYWNFNLSGDLLELRNLSLVANLVIRSAIARKESRGLHFTLDYPHQNDSYLRDTVLNINYEPKKT